MNTEKQTAAYPEFATWAEEVAALDALLATLSPEQWQMVTPFKDWRVFDHVQHLNVFDGWAEKSAARPESFHADRLANPPGTLGATRSEGSPDIPPAELLCRWRDGVAALGRAFAPLDPRARLPWFGPEMSARAFASARQMETWSHGQTIHDTLGKRREATDRIRPICELGWRTMGWSFAVNDRALPPDPVFLELTAPSGAVWTWGDETAQNRITGSAKDFALVVCQCRNVADTQLQCKGALAKEWMSIAQCFAGHAVAPPAPGSRVPQHEEN